MTEAMRFLDRHVAETEGLHRDYNLKYWNASLSGREKPGPPGSLPLTPETGRFLRNRLFSPGASLPWFLAIREATGESLNPEHFLRQFIHAS